MDSYKTVRQFGAAEFEERRSRFIGAAMPISSEQQAVDFINARRSEFWDATHNVYAYALKDGFVRRYSDDSEPQGTAGMPTLDVLLKSGVTDVCVVTTRYFGGVLLGAGGLVRAYSHAASVALEAAGIITMNTVADCRLGCDYHMYGKLDALVAGFGVIDRDTRFSDGVELIFSVKLDDLGALKAAVTDASNGRAQVEELGTRFAAFK